MNSEAFIVCTAFTLVVYDIDMKRTSDFASRHKVEVAASLADIGLECATVITVLPDSKAVRKALCGEGENVQNCVLANLKVGSIVIDMSSSSPVSTRELGALFEARGVKFMDAPVSGGVRRAVTGELAAPAWILFAIVFFWTPPHFWALSLKYFDDYQAAGIPMLPVAKGVPTAVRQILLYSVVVVAITFTLPLTTDHLGVLYVVAAAVLGVLFVAQAIRLARDTTPARSSTRFAQNTPWSTGSRGESTAIRRWSGSRPPTDACRPLHVRTTCRGCSIA